LEVEEETLLLLEAVEAVEVLDIRMGLVLQQEIVFPLQLE
jgi:hypothetical protein